MQEKNIQKKQCTKCNFTFDITKKDLEFYKKVSPKINWVVFEIPSPTLCPECRQQRRLIWRKERWLFKRNCNANWKEIISMYSPDKDLVIYNEEDWWSEKWDSLDYWIDFDFNKLFFDQYKDFIKKIPHKTLINNFRTNENSSFWNNTWNNKNCYLVFEAGSVENCMYSENVRKSKDSLDISWSQFCEHSYELVDCYNSYQCFYSQDLKDCNNVEYSINCINCSDCFLSNDLNWKKNYILNKEYSKEEYLEKIKDFKSLNSVIQLRELLSKNLKNRIVKNQHWFQNEKCNWDYLYNSKNSTYCFDAKNLEDSKYCTVISSSKDICKDCYDYDYFGHSELSYEIITVWQNTYNALFCANTWDNIKNTYYSIECNNVENCFWCFGLINKKYCILNKQYTKEQYNKLVPQIIEHMKDKREWWEFFPSNMSPFWYNETLANEYFPLGKKEAVNQWFDWSDYSSAFPNVEKIISASRLPKYIIDIPDDILNWAIQCEISKKPFRIVKQELSFYRKHNLPIPKKHPDIRHEERMKLRNPRKLFDRKCDKCWVDMKTTYSPDREEIVYCDKCYNENVY